SHTFHGRDVFAPAAAHVACGVAPADLGPPLPSAVELDWPEPKIEHARLGPSRVIASVIYVDRFGNLVTNVNGALRHRLAQSDVSVTIGGTTIRNLSRAYGQLGGHPEQRSAIALINSWGWLEIACPGDSAARRLEVGVGEPVIIEQIGPSARPI